MHYSGVSKAILTALVFCLGLPSFVLAQSGVTGRYRSNFAEHGFFITEVAFKSDSTFEYLWGGDTMWDNGKGCYALVKDTVLLNYFPDENNTFIDETGKVWQDEGIVHPNRPSKLLFRHGRIWTLTLNNKRDKRKIDGYFRRRQFWLFGPTHYRKRPFLYKVQEKKRNANTVRL